MRLVRVEDQLHISIKDAKTESISIFSLSSRTSWSPDVRENKNARDWPGRIDERDIYIYDNSLSLDADQWSFYSSSARLS